MRDRLRSILEETTQTNRLGVFREYLQCIMLRAMHEHHHFNNMAFIGGTALRFVHGLPRFSEDLDFSLILKEGYEFRNMLTEMKNAFIAEGVDVEVKFSDKKTVHNAWYKFPRLMHELDISRDPRRKLSIKLEIDTNPPHGAHLERSLINRHFPLALVYYDLPSLFAGKLHAVLTRAYVKGRDYYDLMWFASRHRAVEPNLKLLNAALEQTRGKGSELDAHSWKEAVRSRIEEVDWAKVVTDVSPFLEDARDIEAMKPEYVLSLFE